MPITGARTSASHRGANGAASAPAAVAASVTATVQNTPKRAPSGPQTNLPIAPPTKTSVSASPMVPIEAPFAASASGKKVRNPARDAVSIMPIPNSTGKPGWRNTEGTAAAGRSGAGFAGDDGAIAGRAAKISTPAAIATAPMPSSTAAADAASRAPVASDGNTTFPTSPAVL